MLTLLLVACVDPGADDRPLKPRPAAADSGDSGAADTGDTADTGDATPAKWQFLVYMDGDNNLEEWVLHDLNELELTGSGDGVEVLVEADRIDGYSEKNGDWTGARRYRIVGDGDEVHITSPVLEDLGEVDMGSPDTLAEFLGWASVNYPAEHRVLVLWDHGDGWSLQANQGSTSGDAAPPPGVAWDDTDGSFLSFAEGTFAQGIAPSVAEHGKIDVIAFDACNMATWEVLHSLVPYAKAVSAAETSEGYEGLQYGTALAFLRANPDADATLVAQELSRGAVEDGGEETHSAWNLDQLVGLDEAIDAIAVAALADADLAASLLGYRRTTRGVDAHWKNWYLDAGDLGAVMLAAGDPTLGPLGADLQTGISGATVHSYSVEEYSWVSGLTLWFDPTSEYIDSYADGAGATWSQDTHWGELMRTYVKD